MDLDTTPQEPANVIEGNFGNKVEKANLETAKIKVEDRSRGRMKITVKLNAEEAVAFRNFSQIKPVEITEEMFWKQCFMVGCNTLSNNLRSLVEAERARQAAEETPEIVDGKEILTD